MKRLICVLAVLSAAFACNENPETPTDEKIPEPDVPGVTVPAAEDGSLDFEIFNDNGGDGLLPEEPAVATVSEPLAMSIIQSSSYTDPDGTVYECEPKAEIVLRASVDTVFVKDIRSLINVSDDADVKTSKEGENPVKHLTKQSFDIGGQTVEFDLSYEVYTYVNSQKQNIEMPYIKLNNADFGSAESVDVKSSVKLSDISIRPLKPAVRSIEVTDSTEYEVTARFNLDAETANLASTTAKTISFEVVYVGVVTQTSTYPGAEYSYNLTDAEGNPVENADFTIKPNSSFELNINQNSSYTDQNGAVTATPKAWTRIVTPDTLRIDKAEDLVEKLSEVSIETHSDELEGNLPYYKLGEVALDGEVAVAEVYKSEDGKLEVYKATATYKQKASPVNIDGGEELEFTYVVEYAGKVMFSGAEFSYEITDAEGNSVENADFTIKPNSSFELNINQNSSYTDRNGAVTATPKAWTRIVTPDTLKIDKAEDLVAKLSEVSIETHSDELEGNLPYYKLGEVALDGEVAVAEVYKSEDGKLEVYKATATYKQKASPVNIDGGEELEFTYVVEYAGKVMFSGAEFSYEITDAEGNSVENADFTIKPNSSFELNINQNSSYTDRNGVVTATPKAWTRIVTPDTLRIEKSEDLVEKLSEVSIETHSDELEGNLPYYKIGEVALDGEVAVAEVSSDGNTIVYKATATYKQKATPVNIDGEKELQFTYVVSFLGKVEVTLVNVEYEQEVIWEDAHDNIKTNSQIVVTRRAKYSDGTVEETKFYSTKNFVQSVVSGDKKDSSGEIEYTYYPMEKTANTFVSPYATGVPDLEHLSYKHRYADSSYVYLGGYEGPEGNWTEYKHMYTNELYDESVQTEGMYGKQFGFRSIDLYSYVGEMKYILRDYKIDLIYKDRFFCIDGRLFTFDPLEHTHRYSIDTIMTANRGKCVLVKNEADVTWLGRDFYYAVVDTVYVKQPSAASSQSASSASSQSVSLASRTASAARPSRPARESRSGSPYVTAPEYQLDDRSGMSLSVETVPGSVPYTVRTVIRPDGTVTTRRYEGIVSDLPLH